MSARPTPPDGGGSSRSIRGTCRSPTTSISKSLAQRTERFTGADLEDLVRRAGLTALRRGLDAAKVTMADFEVALGETRASVTPEMLEEYERIQETLKSEATRPLGGIGFVLPGMLRPKAGGKDELAKRAGGAAEPPGRAAAARRRRTASRDPP